MSNEIPGVAYRETHLGIRVAKTIAMEVAAEIFTTYGRNLITLLYGQVTVEADGGATTILVEEDGGQDLCAATTVTGDVVGTTYFLTGEVAVIFNGTGNAPIIDVGANLTLMPSSPVILGRAATANAIQFVQTGDDTDLEIAWVLFYVPLDDGSFIVAA